MINLFVYINQYSQQMQYINCNWEITFYIKVYCGIFYIEGKVEDNFNFTIIYTWKFIFSCCTLPNICWFLYYELLMFVYWRLVVFSLICQPHFAFTIEESSNTIYIGKCFTGIKIFNFKTLTSQMRAIS